MIQKTEKGKKMEKDSNDDEDHVEAGIWLNLDLFKSFFFLDKLNRKSFDAG